MSTPTPNRTFQPVGRAAAQLGVPRAWLHRLAESGQIPSIRAGGRLLIHAEKARAALEAMADNRADSEGGAQ